MRRRGQGQRRLGREVLIVILALFGGAAVNTLVAWCAAVRSPVAWTGLLAQQPWPGLTPTGWPSHGWGEESSGPALSARRVSVLTLDPPSIPSVDPSLPVRIEHHRWTFEVYSAGWPWRCLCWRSVTETMTVQTIIVRAKSNTTEVAVLDASASGLAPPRLPWIMPDRRLPTTPLCPGLIGGSLLYSLAVYLPVKAPGSVRRWLRARRGRCPGCGYDLAGSTGAACPECGRERAGYRDGGGRRDPDLD